MSFADTLKSDVASIHAAELREAVTYLPRVGTARPIYAIIDREPVATRIEADAGVQVVMSISVNNSAITGISSAEWDRGDKLRVADLIGGSTKDWPLPRPAFQDGGAVVFRINK